MIIDDLKQRLENYLSDQSGASAEVLNLKPLAGGASRDSWMIEAKFGEDVQKLVLRKDYATQMNEKSLTRHQEFDLMQRAYDFGVKVARMRFLCDDEAVLGMPFFIMDFVPGISIGPKVMQSPELEHARSVLPEHMAEQLAKIHTMQVNDFDWLYRPRVGMTPAEETIAATYEILDATGAKVPAFEYALHWAKINMPQNEAVTFIHGDFRIGNLLVDEAGLSAVIDWEFGHTGSPLEELGYLCMRDWRFGNDHLHAAGLCPRERFIQAYEGYSRRAVDRQAVDWWEIVGNLRWGIICLAQANRHLSGEDPSVELASLGRRSAEMQLEALRLIEKIEQL